MSTNTTENLGLSQWLATDPVLREDFNRDNALLDAACMTIPQMTVGSYTGTGVYGPDAEPCTLTFDFCPQMVVISPDSDLSIRGGAIFVRGQSAFNGLGNLDSSNYGLNLALTWGDNSVSWYCASGGSENRQLNDDQITYRYFAIGTKSVI